MAGSSTGLPSHGISWPLSADGHSNVRWVSGRPAVNALWLEKLAVDYAGVMAPQRLGIILLCVGAANALIGTVLIIQFPAERTGGWPYVIIICGLLIMFAGYYTGKRKA